MLTWCWAIYWTLDVDYGSLAQPRSNVSPGNDQNLRLLPAINHSCNIYKCVEFATICGVQAKMLLLRQRMWLKGTNPSILHRGPSFEGSEAWRLAMSVGYWPPLEVPSKTKCSSNLLTVCGLSAMHVYVTVDSKCISHESKLVDQGSLMGSWHDWCVAIDWLFSMLSPVSNPYRAWLLRTDNINETSSHPLISPISR